MKNGTTKTISMTLCAMFTALIAVGAFIRIPLPYMPVTLQTFFVLLSAMLLDGRKGAISALLYMLLGLIGLPVFTEGGGFSYIFKPSFGYIVGFVIGAFVTGKICDTARKSSFKTYFVAGFIGLFIIYAIGITYCCFISAFYLGIPLSLKTVVVSYILLLVPVDLILCFLAAYLSKKLKLVIYSAI